MNSKTGRDKFFKWSVWLAAAGLCLATSIKMMVVGFSADEEYQLLLSYRLAKGDHLFREVWDTLQTSAFYAQFLTWIFIKITHGTEGVLLFLRACSILTQGGVSVFFYSTLKKRLSKESSLLLATAYFCYFTKLLAIPDFSNLQSWGMMILICALWRAWEGLREDEAKGEKWIPWVILAALSYCVIVLSSICLLMIPVIAWLLVLLKKDGGLKRNLIFWGTCALCGVLYLGMLLALNGIDGLIVGIRGVLGGDGTHASGALLSGESKLGIYLRETGRVALYLAATLALAILLAAVWRKCISGRRTEGVLGWKLWLPIWILEGFAVTLFFWIVKGEGFDGLKLYLPVLLIAGIYETACAAPAKRKAKEVAQGGSLGSYEMLPAFFGMLLGICAFLNVLLISNVNLINNLTFLGTAAIWGLAILVSRLEKGCEIGWTRILLCAACLTIAFGSCYTLCTGPAGNNLLQLYHVRGKIQTGPAKGTYVSKQIADAYNENVKIVSERIKPGSRILIVTNFFHNQSLTLLYMVNDSQISHYSVNSTMTYNEKLFEYWERFPDRKPDCIIINGDSCFQEDYQWAMELLKQYDSMEEFSWYSVQYFVRPEFLK